MSGEHFDKLGCFQTFVALVMYQERHLKVSTAHFSLRSPSSIKALKRNLLGNYVVFIKRKICVETNKIYRSIKGHNLDIHVYVGLESRHWCWLVQYCMLWNERGGH